MKRLTELGIVIALIFIVFVSASAITELLANDPGVKIKTETLLVVDKAGKVIKSKTKNTVSFVDSIVLKAGEIVEIKYGKKTIKWTVPVGKELQAEVAFLGEVLDAKK